MGQHDALGSARGTASLRDPDKILGLCLDLKFLPEMLFGQTRQTAAVQSSAARSDQQHSGLRRA